MTTNTMTTLGTDSWSDVLVTSNLSTPIPDIILSKSKWSDPLNIMQLITTTIGVIVNVGTLITLWKNGGAFSKKVKFLFHHQSFADATVSVIIGLRLCLPDLWLTGFYYLDVVVCYMWHSYYLGVIMMEITVWNLVLIAFDRYIAICLPLKYQELTTSMLCIVALIYYVFFSIILLPNLLYTSMVNGKCAYGTTILPPEVTATVLFYYSIYAVLIHYIVPCILFVVLYGLILYTFHQRKKSQDMAQSKLIDKATTELTKTAIVVTVIFIVSMSLESWYYLLGTTGIIQFDVGGVIQGIGWWMSSFNSAANPFIYALLMPVYRQSVMMTYGCKSTS